MVETHALIYYDAIRRATGSRLLHNICKQILHDEVAHIQFQCERLAILHRHRPKWLQTMTRLIHFVFFAVITIAIWTGHRRAYRAGSMNFSRYWRTSWTRMANAWRMMSPSYYHWPENETKSNTNHSEKRASHPSA